MRRFAAGSHEALEVLRRLTERDAVRAEAERAEETEDPKPPRKTKDSSPYQGWRAGAPSARDSYGQSS